MSSSRFEIHPWKIVEIGFCPETKRFSESLFSLGNEHMGMRGFFEEGYSGDTMQGTYIAGVFYPDPTKVGWWKNGYPDFFAKVINSTNWIHLPIERNGKALDFATADVDNVRSELDMKTGLLTRSFDWTENGQKAEIKIERFLSMQRPELALIRVSIDNSTEEAWSFRPGLDGDVRNEDSNYDEVFWDKENSWTEDTQLALAMRTKKTGFLVHSHTDATLSVGSSRQTDKSQTGTDLLLEQHLNAKSVAGETLVLTKYVAVQTSRDFEEKELYDVTTKSLQTAKELGWDQLFAEHEAAWATKWRQSDVKISGDDKAQQGIRYNIFQLMQTYTGRDPRLNIGPKGFTGEKYGGATYWDTEAYCLPFYLGTEPETAKSLLKYRWLHLQQARDNAKKLGLDGALYPMVTMDGQECHNEWEITFEEIHRNGAMAWAIFNYTRFTGDKTWIENEGLEVLVELSRFWSSRVSWSEDKQSWVILGVTGPNEYENNINNNWYTNLMASWTLELTMKTMENIAKDDNCDVEKIREGLNVSADDWQKWQDIVYRMYFPYDEERGVFLQQDGFLDKELKPVSALSPEDTPLHKKWSWDRILRSCYIKQADVLQGLYFFPERFDQDMQKRNFDFYEPMTVHESSLSPCVHAVVASRIGRPEKAYELYLRTARLDLDNYNQDTDDGVHLTSMVGSWLAIVEGFAGTRVDESGLSFTPSLPTAWSGWEFSLVFRNRHLNLAITADRFTVTLSNGAPLDLTVYGKQHTVKEGQPLAVSTESQFVADNGVEKRQVGGVVFDLDGVLTDTAEFHYQAWKTIADKVGAKFDRNINKRLKGVDRPTSLEILLETCPKSLTNEEKQQLLEEKNTLYKQLITTMDEDDLLPGVEELIAKLKGQNIPMAIASASRNAEAVLEKLGIREHFEHVVDAGMLKRNKPDPEVFLRAAEAIGVAPENCVGIEDSSAGIDAILSAGMLAVGVGDPMGLHKGHHYVEDLRSFDLSSYTH